jgi:NAD(P)-dependent dehydrogenase (short-subunit alcohol dehydrogenase family)
MYKGAQNKCLDGQAAVVTGGNTGIGFETSKNLFRRGARVIMLCLDQGHKVKKLSRNSSKSSEASKT